MYSHTVLYYSHHSSSLESVPSPGSPMSGSSVYFHERMVPSHCCSQQTNAQACASREGGNGAYRAGHNFRRMGVPREVSDRGSMPSQGLDDVARDNIVNCGIRSEIGCLQPIQRYVLVILPEQEPE